MLTRCILCCIPCCLPACTRRVFSSHISTAKLLPVSDVAVGLRLVDLTGATARAGPRLFLLIFVLPSVLRMLCASLGRKLCTPRYRTRRLYTPPPLPRPETRLRRNVRAPVLSGKLRVSNDITPSGQTHMTDSQCYVHIGPGLSSKNSHKLTFNTPEGHSHIPIHIVPFAPLTAPFTTLPRHLTESCLLSCNSIRLSYPFYLGAVAGGGSGAGGAIRLTDFCPVSTSNLQTQAVIMAETEASPPPVPAAEEVVAESGGVVAAESGARRDGKPERPRRELEEIPDMTVEEAHKALNALPKVRGGTKQCNRGPEVSTIGAFGSTLSAWDAWRVSR